MLSTIGNLSILCGLFFSCLAIGNSFNIAASTAQDLNSIDYTFRQLKNSRNFQLYSTFAIVLSMITLVAGFVTCDFSLQNVFINSSTLSPLIYKIAGSWSSHEGSMLFFITLLSIMALYGEYKINNSIIKSYASILQQIIISSLLLAIWFSANPFKLSSFVPHEGVGLNPVLQDIALAYHPPILYLGYAFLFIPFSYCLFMYKDKICIFK